MSVLFPEPGRTGDDRESVLAQSRREVGEDLGRPPPGAEQLADPAKLGHGRPRDGRPARPGGSVGGALRDRLVAGDDDLVPFDASARARDDPAAVQELLRQANPPATSDDDRLAFVAVPPGLGAHSPVAHVNDPVGDRGRGGIVAHDDRAGRLAADDLLDQAIHGRGVLRVELGGGLVREQKLRPAAHRCGDGDPLLLAARELVRMRLSAVGEADDLQQLIGALELPRTRHSGEAERERDQLSSRELGSERG